MTIAKSRRKAQPRLSPESEDVLTRVVALLASPDEDRRRDAVARVLQVCLPAVRVLLVERLLNLLCGPRGEAAASSLAEIAPVATLECRLHAASSPQLRVRLVEVLTRVGKAMSPPRRVEVRMALDIARVRARGPEVLTAIWEAGGQLRPTEEELRLERSPGWPTPPIGPGPSRP